MGRSSFVSEARTVKSFPLVVGSRYNIPFLLDSPGVGARVRGEVHRCDDRMLAGLDRLERVPEYYHRRRERVETAAGEELECWLYVLPKFKPDLMKERMLENWTMKDPSIQRYVER